MWSTKALRLPTGYLPQNLHAQPPRQTLAVSWLNFSLPAPLVAWCATCYNTPVIKSFRHKGLQHFYKTGNKRGIQPNHSERLRLQLAALDTAVAIDDIRIPGYRLHALKGKEEGRWSIWVNGNWRLTFEFDDGDAYILDYEDYH